MEPQLKTQAYDSNQITSGVAFIGNQGSAKILGKDEVKSIRTFTVQAGSEYASFAEAGQSTPQASTKPPPRSRFGERRCSATAMLSPQEVRHLRGTNK